MSQMGARCIPHPDLKFWHHYSGSSGEEEDIHDIMACHSTATAERVYAVRSDITKGLTERSIVNFRDVAVKWHNFLGLASLELASKTRRKSSVPRSTAKRPV